MDATECCYLMRVANYSPVALDACTIRDVNMTAADVAREQHLPTSRTSLSSELESSPLDGMSALMSRLGQRPLSPPDGRGRRPGSEKVVFQR